MSTDLYRSAGVTAGAWLGGAAGAALLRSLSTLRYCPRTHKTRETVVRVRNGACVGNAAWVRYC